jgi:GT2 family glycosyltransferase
LDITGIIVNYNGGNFLKKNLDSLINQTVNFKEIIVIDNNSNDDSREILDGYGQIKKIYLNYNSGYASGANRGIKNTSADLILIANADIYLEKNFNNLVIQKFSELKDIDLLSPLILRFDRDTVDSAGQTYSISLYPKDIGYNKTIKKVEIKEGPVFSVCGAATVFRKKSLEKLKIDGDYYDEDFFAFWEDFDIGWRANLLGSKPYFFPKAIAYHYRSATLKKNIFSRFSLSLSRSPEIKYHLIKNRYLTLIKNFRWKHFWWTIPFIIAKDTIWIGLLTLSSPKIIIKLLKSSHYFSKAIKKRKEIRKNE